MAHMYPKEFPRENTSNGERKVFEFFKTHAPSNWYILHSFRLPEHSAVVFGESDFIVIAPEYGIFTLEIKTGGVGFDGTDWMFIDRYHNISKKQRGPFQQAREGMFEVEKIINDHTGSRYPRQNYLYGYGVIFTDEEKFPVSSLTEDESWRLMQNTGNNDYCAFIKTLAMKFKNELRTLKKHEVASLTDEDAKAIVDILRPEIACIAPMKSYIGYSEEDIIKLTNEQFACLDDLEYNDRMVILGGAGTGKTLIACKDAERSFDAGKKTAIFCFNRNLMKYIRKNVPQGIDVFSFHSYLMQLCKNDSTEGNAYDSDFFRYDLPKLALARMEKNPVEQYDKIIIDEFQDLCNKEYLGVFDRILKGGLFDGQFTFYGDFASQAIYSSDVTLDILKGLTYFAVRHLSINCRNTMNIGNEIVNVTGYEDTKYLFTIAGEPVEYNVWADVDDEKTQLKKIIKALSAKQYTSRDIVILSPKSREHSVIGCLDPDKCMIGDIGDNPDEYSVLFSTVHSFKGLESKIVILTGIETYEDVKLMYVALSRARSKMYVLESSVAAKYRKNNMIRRA